VDLSQHFVLTEPGSFNVGAVIRMPGTAMDGTGTNRVMFNQSPGRLYWSQSVGIPGHTGQAHQFRILNFAGDQKNQLYAQIVDDRTGLMVRTFLLGDSLMLRKPLVTVDRQQRMHVMFLASTAHLRRWHRPRCQQHPLRSKSGGRGQSEGPERLGSPRHHLLSSDTAPRIPINRGFIFTIL
jgi:hypothetical protein